MPYETRSKGSPQGPGPFLAEITNHRDPTYMGGVEAVLIKNVQGNRVRQGESLVFRYMTPFYGVTNPKFEGNNNADWRDSQKSYGMWMVPPDIGTLIMVIFIDGDINQGYWIGCVPDSLQNHMVPGLPATKMTAMTPEQKDRYGTENLPTTELLKKDQKLDNPNVNKISKAVHPFADRLLAQGLLLDDVRGITSSGARREHPSQVFGISTPGPLDTSDGTNKQDIGQTSSRLVPVSRLGGSQFVMDDGDVNGQNELVRIRTRTGHQILLHNSADLIYIANSKGTAWLEMTSNGKIDIYAADSISIHSENDFNFRADRDINFEAGRNLNMRAFQHMDVEASGHYFLKVNDVAKLSWLKNKDETVSGNNTISVGENFNLGATHNVVVAGGGDFSAGATGSVKIGSGANLNLTGGNIIGSAGEIHWNGPTADTPDSPAEAETPSALPLWSVPNRSGSGTWAAQGTLNKYKADPLSSIMQRIPTHEPWDQHENINPDQFSPAATDNTLQPRSDTPSTSNAGVQPPANNPPIVAGTCDTKYASMINGKSGQAGISYLKQACKDLNITSPYAIASILAISGGESGWKPIPESGYGGTSPARLRQLFTTRVASLSDAELNAVKGDNVKFYDIIYGGAWGKANFSNSMPGDGYKFRGRGYFQLTGRSNYERYGQQAFKAGKLSSPTALVDNPDQAADPVIGAYIAVLYAIDRTKVAQTNPNYFEVCKNAVGYCTPDIYATKKGLYECFYAQLSAGTVSTGSGGILTDSSGNPVKTGK